MFHLMGLLVWIGFACLAVLTALSVLAAIVYPVFVVWMVIDGVIRTDAEYPGEGVNRKVLWVVLMVLFHPVAIVYFLMVFNKVKRGSAAMGCPAPLVG